MIEFELSDHFKASPETLFAAWLNSEQHSGMTGSPAKVSDQVGEAFNAWEDYIYGKNLELEPPRRILQHWRTSEFENDDDDSLLEILFEPDGEGTKVTIRHSHLPAHGMQYKQGWIDAYFEPMKAYFEIEQG